MRCNGSNWAVYSPGSWDGFRNDLWTLWAGVIMRLEHHLVGGYVRYISPYIIIIILNWNRCWDVCSIPTTHLRDSANQSSRTSARRRWPFRASSCASSAACCRGPWSSSWRSLPSCTRGWTPSPRWCASPTDSFTKWVELGADCLLLLLLLQATIFSDIRTFYKSPFASKCSWKKRSRHQGKKEVACIVSKPLVSCLWGCGESVNPPKLNIHEVQRALSTRPKILFV